MEKISLPYRPIHNIVGFDNLSQWVYRKRLLAALKPYEDYEEVNLERRKLILEIQELAGGGK